MSRYRIDVTPAFLADHPGAYAVVGWDAPLQTYFAQVYTLEPEGEVCDPWIGTTWIEITNVMDLCANLEAYADIPAEIAWQLANDCATGPQPSALQRAMCDLF